MSHPLLDRALLILDDWVLGRVNSHPDLSGIEESSQNMGLSVLKTKSWADREELVTLVLCEN